MIDMEAFSQWESGKFSPRQSKEERVTTRTGQKIFENAGKKAGQKDKRVYITIDSLEGRDLI